MITVLRVGRQQERNADWPSDVDGRIQYGMEVGKDRGFIHAGDNLVVITGWRQGTVEVGRDGDYGRSGQ